MDPDSELKNSISCVECLNALAYCLGPRHQFASYWREGEFDSCRQRFGELKFCFKLKAANKTELREMAKEMLESGKSTTEGVIWEPRPRPDATKGATKR